MKAKELKIKEAEYIVDNIILAGKIRDEELKKEIKETVLDIHIMFKESNFLIKSFIKKLYRKNKITGEQFDNMLMAF